MTIATENRLALLETMLKDISKRLSTLEDNPIQAATLKAIRDDIQGIKMRLGKKHEGTTV